VPMEEVRRTDRDDPVEKQFGKVIITMARRPLRDAKVDLFFCKYRFVVSR